MVLHITLVAEKIGNLWGLPVTNALFTTWITMGVLFLASLFITRKLSLIPSHGQSIAELVVGGLHDFFRTVVGTHIGRFFPLVASLFLFILAVNWIGLLPGVGTVGFFRVEHGRETFIPLLRAGTADLNTTLALALTAVMAIQFYGLALGGRHYLSKFINFTSPLMFGLGILELVSEFSRIVSFAFRLFGNIFAGEVLLTVLAFLVPFVVPIPFLALELFVGLIQALVFSMLTAVFLNGAVTHVEEAHQ